MPQGERERKVKHFSLGPPQGIPKGAALGAPLVTFSATGKSPGCRAERLHRWVQGLWSLHKSPGAAGAPPLAWGAQRGASPSR